MEADITEKTSDQIVRILLSIDEKLDKIAKTQNLLLERLERPPSDQLKGPMQIDVSVLLKLPDHLRRSAQTLMELKRATAEEVASQTHRTRAAESDYLNQLVEKGYVKKEREGRTVFFSVR